MQEEIIVCSSEMQHQPRYSDILQTNFELPYRSLLSLKCTRNGQERRDFADFAFSAVFGNEAAVDRSTFMRLYPHFALHPDSRSVGFVWFCPEMGHKPRNMNYQLFLDKPISIVVGSSGPLSFDFVRRILRIWLSSALRPRPRMLQELEEAFVKDD